MLDYNDKQVQTQLIDTGFKPLLSPDCVASPPSLTLPAFSLRSRFSFRAASRVADRPQHTGFTSSLENAQASGSPINLTLGDHTIFTTKSRLALVAEPGGWSDLVRRQINLGDPTPTSRLCTPVRPVAGTTSWQDLIDAQINLEDPTIPTQARMITHAHDQKQRGVGNVGVNDHPTWDDLVQQGAMLGDDGTDTLVMKEKARLFE